MLRPDQIDALRESARKVTDPITVYLLRDIARRISEAGELTSTAAYQVWRAQQLGVSQREIKKELRRLLHIADTELAKLLTQSAEDICRFDLDRFPTVEAVPFERNAALQQIVSAAVELARDDFSNIVQTIGFVTPRGTVEPLTRAYITSCDFAFQQAVTGAASYTEAIRQATRNLADKGIRTIDYESGVHTALEAAVRRNIMGGLGLMQEQVSQAVHEQLGCDGWEITAHANNAPDHEPIQGKQYPDAAYTVLNNSLRRRIGTLNCGHAAFPIILGVNAPQYSPEELEKFRADNEKGVTVDGVHYTGYAATQMQRSLERAIRRQKQRVMVDEAAGDREKLAQDKTKLEILHQRYQEFSQAAGLRTLYERTEVAGFEERYGPLADLKEYPDRIQVVGQFSEKQYHVKLDSPQITGTTQHFTENLSGKSDRAGLTIEAAQGIINNSRMILYQTDRRTLKFLADTGYAVVNLQGKLITVVPEKLRKKYKDYLEGEKYGEKS